MADIDEERLRKVLVELKDSIVIVEGKKDAEALQRFGIDPIPINSMPLEKFVENLLDRTQKSGKNRDSPPQMGGSGEECRAGSDGGVGTGEECRAGSDIVILTDFDREGRHIASRIRAIMERNGLHPNTRLRREMMSFRRNKIEDFGKLAKELDSRGRLKNIRSDKYGEISANFDKICN